EWKPVGKVKCRVSSTRITRRSLNTRTHVIEAEETVPKSAKGQRRLPLARKDSRSGKPKLKVFRGLETELVAVKERIRREIVPGKLSEEVVIPHRTQQLGNPWDVQGRCAVDAQHIDRLGVVAEDHSSALFRSPPQGLLANRNLVAKYVDSGVGVEQAELVRSLNRNGRLFGI